MTLNPGEIELIIDPKQAFGTGHHTTTQLLIEWLQQVVTSSDRVLDVGTGSGVLAMVALRLGAAKAVGEDFDPVAIDCARDYAQVNGFDDRIDTIGMRRDQGTQPCTGPAPRGTLGNEGPPGQREVHHLAARDRWRWAIGLHHSTQIGLDRSWECGSHLQRHAVPYRGLVS